jgi:hypothetical protein
MSTTKRYVLGKLDPPATRVFLCGPDPVEAQLDVDPRLARQFPSPEEALAYRRQLHPPAGDPGQYRVYELTAEGTLTWL